MRPQDELWSGARLQANPCLFVWGEGDVKVLDEDGLSKSLMYVLYFLYFINKNSLTDHFITRTKWYRRMKLYMIVLYLYL